MSLKRRERQSAIVAQIGLIFLFNLPAALRTKGVVETVPKWMVAAAVRLHDVRHHKPISENKLAKNTRLPRGSVHRYTEFLVRRRIINKVDGGFTSNMQYLRDNRDARHFRHMVSIIRRGAKELERTL